MQSLAFETLIDLAQGVGLSIVGVADGTQMASDLEHLKVWQGAGYAGEMGYMQREPELLASPQRLLQGVRSVVTVALAYDRAPRPPLQVGYGRVARYAWGRDYHKVLRRRLEQLTSAVERHLGCTLECRAFSDSVPLLERALAQRSQIAFIGKNTMAIIPGRGSFFLLGEILWELEILGAAPLATAPQRCGTCTTCINLCPTEAFVSERVLDARRCISYLTIEKRGALTHQERAWVGEWVFGCDVCQEVCPFNFVSLKRGERAAVKEFDSESGVGPALDLGSVLEIRTQAAFVTRFAGTALMRTKREGLLRNAAVVAANTAALDLLASLKRACKEDPSPVVRQHALWAFVSLCLKQGGVAINCARDMVLQLRSDSAEQVRCEGSELEQLL